MSATLFILMGDARGLTQERLEDGCQRSTLDELTEWTQAADKVLVF